MSDARFHYAHRHLYVCDRDLVHLKLNPDTKDARKLSAVRGEYLGSLYGANTAAFRRRYLDAIWTHGQPPRVSLSIKPSRSIQSAVPLISPALSRMSVPRLDAVDLLDRAHRTQAQHAQQHRGQL